MCGELWIGRGEREGRMLGEGRGGEFQEGERWGVTTPGHYPDGEGDQEVGQQDVEPDLQS